MLYSRYVLHKGFVLLVADNPATSLTFSSPLQQSTTLSVGQCLCIERYRGLTPLVGGQNQPSPQAPYATTRVSARGRAPAPALLNASKSTHSPSLTRPAQRQECRFVSRLARPGGRPGAKGPPRSGPHADSSSNLLRSSSDGIGTLDGLKPIEDTTRDDTTVKVSDRSKIQRELEADKAAIIRKRSEETAAIKRAKSERREAEQAKQKLYDARVRDPIRQINYKLSNNDWQDWTKPAWRELLLQIHFRFKHAAVHAMLETSSQQIVAMRESLVRWEQYQHTLEQAAVSILEVLDHKLLAYDPGRTIFGSELERSVNGFAKTLYGLFNTICHERLGTHLHSNSNWILVLLHRGSLSPTQYRALANLIRSHSELVILLKEIENAAHFVRKARLERRLDQCLPGGLSRQIAHSSPILECASALVDAASSSHRLFMNADDYIQFGAWQTRAYKPSRRSGAVGRYALQQKARLCRQNAYEIERLCYPLFHLDSDLIDRSTEYSSPVAGLIFRYVEAMLDSQGTIATIRSHHNLLWQNDRFQGDDFASDDLGVDGTASLERSDVRFHGTQSFEVFMGRLLSMWKVGFHQTGPELRHFASCLRYLGLLQCAAQGIPVSQHGRKLGSLASRPNAVVSTAFSESTSDILPTQTLIREKQPETFWLYPQAEPIPVEYAGTYVTSYLCLRGLATSKIVSVDIVLTAHVDDPLSNLRQVRLLTLASADKVVIMDFGAMGIGKRSRVWRDASILDEALRDFFHDPAILKVGVGMRAIRAILHNRHNFYVNNHFDIDRQYQPSDSELGSAEPNLERLATLSKEYLQWDIEPLPRIGPDTLKPRTIPRPSSMLFGHLALRAYAAYRLYCMQSTDDSDGHAMPPFNIKAENIRSTLSGEGEGKHPHLSLASRDLGPLLLDPEVYSPISLAGNALKLAEEILARQRGRVITKSTRLTLAKEIEGLGAYLLLTRFSQSLTTAHRVLSIKDPYTAAVNAAKRLQRPFRPDHLETLTKEAERLGMISPQSKPNLSLSKNLSVAPELMSKSRMVTMQRGQADLKNADGLKRTAKEPHGLKAESTSTQASPESWFDSLSSQSSHKTNSPALPNGTIVENRNSAIALSDKLNNISERRRTAPLSAPTDYWRRPARGARRARKNPAARDTSSLTATVKIRNVVSSLNGALESRLKNKAKPLAQDAVSESPVSSSAKSPKDNKTISPAGTPVASRVTARPIKQSEHLRRGSVPGAKRAATKRKKLVSGTPIRRVSVKRKE